MGHGEVDLEEDGSDDAATLNEETYPDAAELEGSKVDYSVEDNQGLRLGKGVKMPQLVHMMSAPDELPQTTPGRWPHRGGRDGLDQRDDVLGDLRGYKDDDGFLEPTGTSARRRSNFI